MIDGNYANRKDRTKGKKMSENEKNVFEETIREIVKLVLTLGGKPALEKFMALSNLFAGMFRFYEIVKGWEREVLADQICVALDGMVGTESDALIGPNGELLKFDTGIVPIEGLTDLILNSMKNKFAEAA